MGVGLVGSFTAFVDVYIVVGFGVCYCFSLVLFLLLCGCVVGVEDVGVSQGHSLKERVGEEEFDNGEDGGMYFHGGWTVDVGFVDEVIESEDNNEVEEEGLNKVCEMTNALEM